MTRRAKLVGLAVVTLSLGGCSPRPLYRVPLNPSLESPSPASRPLIPVDDPALPMPPPVSSMAEGEGDTAPQDSVATQLGEIARQWLGTPYRRGGESPRGMDCSGLACTVYQELGVRLPRSTGEQRLLGRLVSAEDVAPGDLLFFRMGSRRVNHVGVALGSQEFLHASLSRGVVVDRLDDTYFGRRLAEARRVLGDN